MIIARLNSNDFGYELVLFLHLLFVVVGFGSSFVWPMLASRARKATPQEAYAMNSAALQISKPLTTYSIILAGFFGIVLTGIGEQWKFSQPWVSIAFLLFVVGLVVSLGLHGPNLKVMDKLQETLVSGGATQSPEGGPPAEVVELQARGKRAGMYGGILHLVFVLLMIDMVWKPFYP